MPINAGLINALTPQVRSVEDYRDDYTRRDIAQQGLQRNALLLQEDQALQQDRTRTRMEQDGLNNALRNLGGNATPEQMIAAARGVGNRTGHDFADAREKSWLERQKSQSAIYKDDEATATSAQNRKIEADKQVRARLQGAQNPKEAADIARAAVAGGFWDQSQAMAALDGMPIDLTQFDGWRQRQLAGALAPKDLLPSNGHVGLGGSMGFTSTDPWGRVTMTGSQPITQSADSQASERTAAAGRTQAAQQFGVTSGLAERKFGYDQKKDAAELTSGGKATEGERNAAGYAARMVEATKLLDQYEKDGRATYRTEMAGGLPLVGNAARTAVMSPVQQQYRQAQEDWVRAKLRKESGAAIGVDEMDREIASYFPQPGEAKPVIDQKRRARAVAVEGMGKAAGRAGYDSTVPATAVNPLSAAEKSELEQLRAKLGRK